jgi:hypothetical protein
LILNTQKSTQVEANKLLKFGYDPKGLKDGPRQRRRRELKKSTEVAFS